MKKFTRFLFFTFSLISTLQFSAGAQSLVQAVQSGDTSQITQLIVSGANVNQADSTGTTPLMLACSLGDTLTAQLLIANGANTNLIDSTGKTALIISANNAYSDLINLLLIAGADPLYRVNSMRAYDFAIEADAATLQNESSRNSAINQKAAISALRTALGY